MSVFVDTSGLLAVLDAGDHDHPRAAQAWKDLLLSEEELVTTNYVVVETSALVQRRLGMAALRLFQEDVVPALSVEWAGEAAHAAAIGALLSAPRRNLSLVDWVSFTTMRLRRITTAFTLDRHFRDQGFHCLPSR